MAIKGLNPDFCNVFTPTLGIPKPFEVYDAKGNLIGYSWHYGDTVNLQFSIMGEVTVDSNAIIYKAHGMKPTQNTAGEINQKCYNIDDLISWTCTGISPGTTHRFVYEWTQDNEFTYPDDGVQDVYITAKDFVKNKLIQVQILNLKRGIVESRLFEADTMIEFIVNRELSERLTVGTYLVTLTLIDRLHSTSIELLGGRDCQLIVKA